MKLLYFHVPKTAGSSLNTFFGDNISKHIFHIESIKNVDKEFCKSYQFLSGHVTYNKMNHMLDLDKWITFVTLREPVSYVISHLKWVRKLADPGQEGRFNQHPEIFQKIALKMTEFDFSKPEEITKFISWLESINFYYFHSTQIFYIHIAREKGVMTDQQVNHALKNLSKIDFVGIQEELDDFMKMLSYEFSWDIADLPKENINEINYGFDINDPATRKALLPLYKYDIVLYKEAKKIYQKQKNLYHENANKNITGYIMSMSPNAIRGWVYSKSSLKKVKLDLIVNGKCIQRTKATLFRQRIKNKKQHPSGLCGFRFLLKNDIDITKCKVYIRNTNIELPRVKNHIKE